MNLLELRRLDHFVKRFERKLLTSGEVLLERFVGFGRTVRACGEQLLQFRNDDRVDQCGARGSQFRECFVEDGLDLGEIRGRRIRLKPDRFAQDAEPRAFQAIPVEEFSVGVGNMSDTPAGERVFGIVSNDDIHQTGEIGDTAGHRAERAVGERPAIIHSAAADKTGRRPHSHDAVPGRRPADRCKSFFTDSHGREVR